MKRILILPLALLVLPFFVNCGGADDLTGDAIDPNKIEKVEGGKFRGGVLRLNSIEEYTSCFPAAINDIYSTHIAGQVYEGLFKFNQQTLEAEPCLAESFEIDNSKKKYTFHIRKGVYYHDDACFPDGKGREITANDFKYCFEFLCSAHEENKWSTLFRDKLVGAVDYENGKAKSVSGIKVVDTYTLELMLLDPFASFPDLLAVLAAAVYPKEAIDEYGYEGMHNYMVGCGPFIATTLENGKNVEFIRNEKYWKKDEFGNQLPYLAKVTFSFIKEKPQELKSFKDGNLDMVWGIPVEEINNIMGSFEEAMEGKNREFDVQSCNSLNIQYYGFLYTSETFKDVRVRKAFNYAIDRDSLVEFVLQGEGIPAHHGFVPPMSGYPSETVKGFDYNPELAKKLMKEAGFPGGKGFPEITLHLNSGGGVYEKIAAYMQETLKKNLGITMKLNVIEMKDLHPQAEKGKLDFWRFGWIADYPDPSNFLYLFHGNNIVEGKESSINYFRYSNPVFDATYDAALKEIDDKKRMKLFAECDQILMDDAVIMPLLFNVDIRLINPEVKGFDINELEYRDLAVVYFELDKKTNIRVYDNLGEDEEEEVIE